MPTTHRAGTTGASARQVKRRRARFRAAGISLDQLPPGYLHATTEERSAWVARGQVPIEVGAADTSPQVRWTAQRVLWLTANDLQTPSTAQLAAMARLPIATANQLEALVVEAERRGRSGGVVEAVCEHPQCPSTLLEYVARHHKGNAAAAALLQQALRGESEWDSLPPLTINARQRLAQDGPPAAAAKLVTDPSTKVRIELARRALPHAAALVLATDHVTDVRLTLALHTTDGRILEWLRNDSASSVRAAVRYPGDLIHSS